MESKQVKLGKGKGKEPSFTGEVCRLGGTMEENFTGKEVYRQNFVPKDYLNTYYSLNTVNQEEANIVKRSLKNLHKIFVCGE